MRAGPTASSSLVRFTSEIVGAYLTRNSIQREEVPRLIGSVYTALAEVRGAVPKARPKSRRAIDRNGSITMEFLVSFEDGKRYKALTRHLRARGLTPAEYRAKWGLPDDYPMVAPTLRKARSYLTKKIGLRKPKESNVIRLSFETARLANSVSLRAVETGPGLTRSLEPSSL